MAARNDELEKELSRHNEIDITATGRKSGRLISIPIWFVFDQGELHLLPVQGSDTQWYKNVLSNPKMQISIGGKKAEFRAVPITDAAQVSSVVEQFRQKYGAGDVKKYYPKHNVAVLAQKV